MNTLNMKLKERTKVYGRGRSLPEEHLGTGGGSTPQGSAPPGWAAAGPSLLSPASPGKLGLQEKQQDFYPQGKKNN